MSAVVGSTIVQRFGINPTDEVTLLRQLEQFFTKAGVTNNHIFGFMSDPTSWPDPNRSGPNQSSLKSVTRPVILLLSVRIGGKYTLYTFQICLSKTWGKI